MASMTARFNEVANSLITTVILDPQFGVVRVSLFLTLLLAATLATSTPKVSVSLFFKLISSPVKVKNGSHIRNMQIFSKELT